MAGKSPSGLEMVLKGLDNQLEIATLDSLDYKGRLWSNS